MNPENRPIFLASEETKKVIAKLESTTIGQIIPWNELSAAVGGDVQKARACIVTARKNLLNDKQMVFAAVRGVGLKRIANADVVRNEGMVSSRIRCQVKRSMKRLSTVDPASLEGSDKTDYAVTSATLGAISLCTSKKFEGVANQLAISNGNLAPEETLKLFLK